MIRATAGLVTGLMTTIHADTGDQMLLVRAAQDLRRAKSGLSQGEPSRLACPAARSPQKQGLWAYSVTLRSAGLPDPSRIPSKHPARRGTRAGHAGT